MTPSTATHLTAGNRPSDRYLLALALITALTGCAALDPHNILGRRAAEQVIATTPVPMPDSDWKQRALDQAWTTINERYYDAKLNGVDWVAVRARYQPLLLATSGDDAYWELLDKMTGELKDSHTRIHSPKLVAQQQAAESHSLGIGFAEIDGALLLTSVHADSDAYWAGARAGMTIHRIDDEPALALYRRQVAEARDTSTPWARTRGAVRKISSGDIGTPLTMVFARSDGSEFTATMKRRKFRAAPQWNQRLLPSGFGYVRFSNFVGALQSDVLTAIDEMKDAPGMILDLRGNGGGSLGMAQRIAAKFLSAPTKAGRLLTRTGKPISVFFIDVLAMEPELKGDRTKAYTKPLVILVNEGSASASEFTAAVLQDLRRATVIGQRTCGCLLGFLGLADLPGGGQMAYSEMGFVTPKGRRIEHQGVVPDIAVTLTRDDYLQNRDRVLEAAEVYLINVTKFTALPPPSSIRSPD